MRYLIIAVSLVTAGCGPTRFVNPKQANAVAWSVSDTSTNESEEATENAYDIKAYLSGTWMEIASYCSADGLVKPDQGIPQYYDFDFWGYQIRSVECFAVDKVKATYDFSTGSGRLQVKPEARMLACNLTLFAVEGDWESFDYRRTNDNQFSLRTFTTCPGGRIYVVLKRLP